jgi:hypothetical protein
LKTAGVCERQINKFRAASRMRSSFLKDKIRAGVRYASNSSARAVYDPGAHKEFVTGFRRRKQARRAQASKDIAAADKQARRDARKERRNVLRRTADRARGFVTSSDDEQGNAADTADNSRGLAQGEGGEVGNKMTGRVTKVYDGLDESVVTTTVTPIQTFTDSHFDARLPQKRNMARCASLKSSACSAHSPSRERTFERPQNLGASLRNGRRMTHSGAKKLSKANRHSRIAKIKRNRRRDGTG